MRIATRSTLLAFTAMLFAGPAFAAGQDDLDSIWTLRVENDAISTFPKGSDQNYTAGQQIGWTSGANAVPDFTASLSHFFWGDGTTRVGLGISQQLYTPTNKTLTVPDPRDRPYAGYAALTGTLMHDGENTRDLFSLSVGVIGPLAQGGEAQNGVHMLIGDKLARGWAYQLPNEAAVEVLDQRTWRFPVGQFAGLETDILPAVAVGGGTVRDYLQGAMVVRFGRGLEADYGPSRIRPGISGGDAFADSDKVAWYVFAGADGQYVARDAFLDGNLFSRSAHVQREPLLGELEAGFAIIWRGARLSYAQTWQTTSFKHQGSGLFNFGSLTASVRF